jgi:replicative DNA helicase/5S rRNA maturation endonuclease (ribonuclease M5)
MDTQNNYNLIKNKVRIRSIFNGETIDVAKGWKALSPFKKETDASFKVTENADGDLWYCFSTKQGGDVFDYYEKVNHVDSKIAFYELAKLAGVKTEDIYAKVYASDELLELESKLVKNHSFFVERGISKEVLNKYGVGYIEDINKLDLNSDVILKYNLAGIKNSIVYLIKDAMGRNIGFYSRPIVRGANKYIGYSPTQVYGLHQLNNKTDFVIVVEGQNDVLKLRTEGIENVIGVSGTNFNYKIFDEFRKLNIRKVVFIPDADGGGHSFINNIVDGYGTFDTYGIRVKYAIIPEVGLDPEEFVSKNKDFFINIPEVDPIVTYFKKIEGDNIDKIRNILRNKVHLKAYEIQLALKDELNGIIDIKTIFNDLYHKEYEEIFLSNILNNRILYNKAKSEIPLDTMVIYKQVYQFIIENENVSIATIKNHFGIEFGKIDINGHQIYVQKLIKLREKRTIYDVLNSYSTSILSENVSLDAMISSMMVELNQSYTNNTFDATSIETAVEDMVNDINNDKFDGLSIEDKFPQLNCMVRGILRGRLIEVGGPSGEGKTTLACNFVDSISVKQQHKTLFLSGEMAPKEMALKQMSISSGIPMEDIISRKTLLTKEHLKPILDSRLYFNNLPLIEETETFLNRQFLLNGGFDLIVYDYVQLSLSALKIPRHMQLAMLTRILKQFAQKQNVAIVAIAQLNRSASQKDVAGFDDLSGAYDMKADADVCIAIKKKKTKEGVLADGNAELNLDKSRFSRDKVLIPVVFKGATNTIYEVT